MVSFASEIGLTICEVIGQSPEEAAAVKGRTAEIQDSLFQDNKHARSSAIGYVVFSSAQWS